MVRQVSLDDFLDEARRNVDKFGKYWRRMHSENPEMFQMEFNADNAGTWWEMLHEFDSGRDSDGDVSGKISNGEGARPR